MGNWERAIDDYDAAIKIYPDNIKNYYKRGNVFLEVKNYIKAISDFNKVIELKPD